MQQASGKRYSSRAVDYLHKEPVRTLVLRFLHSPHALKPGQSRYGCFCYKTRVPDDGLPTAQCQLVSWQIAVPSAYLGTPLFVDLALPCIEAFNLKYRAPGRICGDAFYAKLRWR